MGSLSFEIKSYKPGGRGKPVKTALAFYDILDGVKITNNASYGAKNAFSSEGTVNNGDAGVEVRDGPATFMRGVKFQNTAPPIFHKDVYFGDTAKFINTNAVFKDKVYFDDYVEMQGLTNTDIFNSSVGFNKNIVVPGVSSTSPQNFNVNGDVWINGTFGNIGDVQSAQSITFTNVGAATNKFNYTDNFQMKKRVMGCKDEPPTCSHTSHPIDDKQVETFSNRDYSYHSSKIDIADKMNMGNLDTAGSPGSRMDPELDINKATDPSKGGASKMYTLKEMMDSGNAGQNTSVSAKILNEAYEKAKNNGHLTNDDYMVVRLGTSSTDNNFNWNGPSSAETFNEKVIFVLESNYAWRGSYFPTTTESSTLIYVKDNALLDELKINAVFNGLIYTDKKNIPTGGSNRIKVDPINGKIVGAIHNHSSGNLQWNTTGSNVPPVIQFSEAALNKFARMSTNGTSGEWKTEYTSENNEKRVRLRAAGYYFY
jgi:hypothetical protein